MTPMKKPEWFQMAEADEAPLRSMKQRTRIGLLVAPLLIVSGGFVFAQSQDGPPATADMTVTSAQSQSPVSAPSSQSPSTSAAVSATPTKASVQQVTATTPSNTVSSNSNNTPPIAKPTAPQGDDDAVNTQKKTRIPHTRSGGIQKPPTGGHEGGEGFEGGQDD
ncbi:MAG: hypothetical protein WCK72_03125 [Actinomycetes bacterium]